MTVGDELLCGDVSNTNARWLSRELESLGLHVRVIATLPDDRPSVVEFVRWARREHDVVVVTGGLGGTPDDVTRDALADAFAVGRRLNSLLAAELETSGGHCAVFASEWSRLPEGSRVLRGAPGGAPGFAIENVYALAGVPTEMRATFKTIRDELRAGPPRCTWRRMYSTTEDQIAPILAELVRLHPDVFVGSYPRFGANGPQVELVLRASNRRMLAPAASRMEAALNARGIEPRVVDKH